MQGRTQKYIANEKATYAPVRISPQNMKRVVYYANEHRRSLTMMVNLLLVEALDERDKKIKQ